MDSGAVQDPQATEGLEENPLKAYAQDIVDSVPSLLCLMIGDVHGSCRLHAAKDTDWRMWRHLSRLFIEPDQLEQTLQCADNLPRKLQRSLLWMDDYVVLQHAHYPSVEAKTSENSEFGLLTPTVVVTLVGKAVDGEGDVGALAGLIERMKTCPMFEEISKAVIMESYEY